MSTVSWSTFLQEEVHTPDTAETWDDSRRRTWPVTTTRSKDGVWKESNDIVAWFCVSSDLGSVSGYREIGIHIYLFILRSWIFRYIFCWVFFSNKICRKRTEIILKSGKYVGYPSQYFRFFLLSGTFQNKTNTRFFTF